MPKLSNESQGSKKKKKKREQILKAFVLNSNRHRSCSLSGLAGADCKIWFASSSFHTVNRPHHGQMFASFSPSSPLEFTVNPPGRRSSACYVTCASLCRGWGGAHEWSLRHRSARPQTCICSNSLITELFHYSRRWLPNLCVILLCYLPGWSGPKGRATTIQWVAALLVAITDAFSLTVALLFGFSLARPLLWEVSVLTSSLFWKNICCSFLFCIFCHGRSSLSDTQTQMRPCAAYQTGNLDYVHESRLDWFVCVRFSAYCRYLCVPVGGWGVCFNWGIWLAHWHRSQTGWMDGCMAREIYLYNTFHTRGRHKVLWRLHKQEHATELIDSIETNK